MATNYPTSIDTFVNPTSNDSLNAPSHSQQHTNLNDAMIAVQTKLGYGSADKVGMYLVKTQTIGTAVTSVTVTDAFNSIYDNYRIIIYVGSHSGGAGCTLQLSGITGSNYYTGGYYQAWGTSTMTGHSPAVQTYWDAGFYNVVNVGSVLYFDIANPNVAAQKFGTMDNPSGNGNAKVNVRCSSTAQATGFTYSKSSGETITGGTIYVYGYNKG